MDKIKNQRQAACDMLDILQINAETLITRWGDLHQDESPMEWAADLRDRIQEIRHTMDLVERVVMRDLYEAVTNTTPTDKERG